MDKDTNNCFDIRISKARFDQKTVMSVIDSYKISVDKFKTKIKFKFYDKKSRSTPDINGSTPIYNY